LTLSGWNGGALADAAGGGTASDPPTIDTIRRALQSDVDILVEFTLQEGYEAEGAPKEEAAVRRGVEGGFKTPPLAEYWVAEGPEKGIVGSTSVVTEWSVDE